MASLDRNRTRDDLAEEKDIKKQLKYNPNNPR